MMVSRRSIAVLAACLAPACFHADTPAFAQAQSAAAEARKPAIRSDADARRIVRLVRTTFAAVHQANLAGNYAVFRDLAAPSLRSSMSLVDLGTYFAPLRKQNVDLSRALMTVPKFRETPVILRDKFLVLKGYIPGKPRIAFDFTYQRVGGRWRFVNIAIKPLSAEAAASAPQNDAPEGAHKRAAAPPPPPSRRGSRQKQAATPAESEAGARTRDRTPASRARLQQDHWPMRLWYSLPGTGGR